jgi:hypothetical protein
VIKRLLAKPPGLIFYIALVPFVALAWLAAQWPSGTIDRKIHLLLLFPLGALVVVVYTLKLTINHLDEDPPTSRLARVRWIGVPVVFVVVTVLAGTNLWLRASEDPYFGDPSTNEAKVRSTLAEAMEASGLGRPTTGEAGWERCSGWEGWQYVSWHVYPSDEVGEDVATIRRVWERTAEESGWEIWGRQRPVAEVYLGGHRFSFRAGEPVGDWDGLELGGAGPCTADGPDRR